jgi:hypothetical protein
VNTYLSRDAGWTWYQIANGSNTYEIADHGSLIVLADDTKATSQFTYTWNEGLTMETCTFTTQGDVEVENIVVEPTWTSQKFILYGRRRDKGVLIHLDFSDMHETVCKNPEKAGQADSDYELWSPTDNGFAQTTDDKKCILGAHTVYTRKKREAKCSNPLSYEPTSKSTPCECTREDYQCDYCYELGPDGTCSLACGDYDPTIPPTDCIDYYLVTQGYRLVPGDSCKGGLDLRPRKHTCSGTTSPGGSSHTKGGLNAGAIVAILVILAASIALGIVATICGVLKFKKPQILYEKLSNIQIFKSNS